MAGEVHPVPFRTRKLSPPAPMVLRSKSVGEQDVADQRGAFSRSEGGRPRAGRPPFAVRGPWHAAASGLCPVASPRRLPVMSGSRSPTKFDRVQSARAVFLRSVPRGRPVPPSAWGGPGRPLLRGAARGRPLSRMRPPRVVCKPWRRPAPLAGGGAGAYINSSRDGAAADAGGPSAGRTLRTGYRDRRGRASYRQHYYLGWLASARQAPRRFLSLNGR